MPGSFRLMVRSAFTAHSLSFALRRLGESFALLQDDVALVPVTEGRLTGVALDMRGPGAHADFLHAHLLRVFWRLLVWLHGGRLVPQRFDFNFAPPPHAQNYQRIFSGTLCFGQRAPPGSTPMPSNSRCGAIGTRCSPSCAPRQATWWGRT